MEAIINNLGYNALVPMWNTTFPNWSIEDYIDTLESTDDQLVNTLTHLNLLMKMKYCKKSEMLSLMNSED